MRVDLTHHTPELCPDIPVERSCSCASEFGDCSRGAGRGVSRAIFAARGFPRARASFGGFSRAASGEGFSARVPNPGRASFAKPTLPGFRVRCGNVSRDEALSGLPARVRRIRLADLGLTQARGFKDRPVRRRAVRRHGGLHPAPHSSVLIATAMFLKRRLSHAHGYLELGMVAEAAAELEQVGAADAERIEVLALRLAVLHEQRDWRSVRALAASLVQRGVADAGVWVTWAYATRRADSLDAAEKILLTAEQQHPADPTIQFNLACYACQRGDLRNARRRVDRAIELDSKFKALAANDPDLEPLREAEGRADCQPGA